MVVEKKDNADLYHALAFLGQITVLAERNKASREFAHVVHFEQSRTSLEHTFGLATEGHNMHIVPFIRSVMDKDLIGDYFVKTTAKQVELTKCNVDTEYPNWRIICTEADALATGKTPLSAAFMPLNDLRSYRIGDDLGDILYVLARCNIKILLNPLKASVGGVLKGDWYLHQKANMMQTIQGKIDNVFGGAVVFKFADFKQMFGEYAITPTALVMPSPMRSEKIKHPLCGLDGFKLLVNELAGKESGWDAAAVKKALTERYLF